VTTTRRTFITGAVGVGAGLLLARPTLARAATLPVDPPLDRTLLVAGDTHWTLGATRKARLDAIYAGIKKAGWHVYYRLHVGDGIEGASATYLDAAGRKAQRDQFIAAEKNLGGPNLMLAGPAGTIVLPVLTVIGNHDQFRDSGSTDGQVIAEWEKAFGYRNSSVAWNDGRRCVIRVSPDRWAGPNPPGDASSIEIPKTTADFITTRSGDLPASNPVQVLNVHACLTGTFQGNGDWPSSDTDPMMVKDTLGSTSQAYFRGRLNAADKLKLMVSGHAHIGRGDPGIIKTVPLDTRSIVHYNAPGLVRVGAADTGDPGHVCAISIGEVPGQFTFRFLETLSGAKEPPILVPIP
jgi:hypothetical protein